MKVKFLIQALIEDGLLIKGFDITCNVNSITYDSRQVKKDSLFICKGAAFKKEYLESAVLAGACVYLSECEYDVSVPAIIVSDIRKAMAVVSDCFYGHPSEKLDVLGITGTKGKTTTAFITRTLLQASNQRYGLLSSVLTDTGLSCKEAHLTTPESPDLQQMFAEMCDAELTGAIMEVSSQGLAYERVKCVKFDRAVFLNIGQDHISPIEHATFEDYFEAKKKIFDLTKSVCINLDDEHSQEMLECAQRAGCEIITFGFNEDADVYAYDYKRDGKNTKFRVRSPYFDRKFTLPLIGAFNVYNALAAICLCLDKVSANDLVKGMRRVTVPGRMQVLEGKDITVIVDYAHNKMSFERLFTDMRNAYPDKRLISVYGCPGGKAYLRRTDLGEVSGKLADYTILTAEDPNFDSVEQINEEIASHILSVGGRYESILDREEAIKKAILAAQAGDLIVITGKGEEIYQKVAGNYEPYEGDIPLSKKYLKKREVK